MPNAILDPTGQQDRALRGGAFALAPRRGDLAGARVGLLINTKRNADLFLHEVGRLLREEHGAASVLARTKMAFAQPVSEDILKELVSDGIMLERAGIPTAVICSDAFSASADAIAGLRGVPGYRYLTTRHPMAVLTPDEVRDRARQLLPQVVSMLTADEAGQA
jgi:hypothetical protein